MNEFLTWDMLGTFAGCLGATVILTEFLKKIFPKIHPQIVSYVIALVILVCVKVVAGAFAWNDILLQVMNAAVVSLAANGGFDAVKDIFGGGNKSDGQLVVYDEGDGESAVKSTYVNFAKDPKEFRDGQKLTFTYKTISQE